MITGIALVTAILPAFDTATVTASANDTDISDPTDGAWSRTAVLASAEVAPTLRNRIATFQETSTRIAYRGHWSRVRNSRYLGRQAISSNRRGAMASLQFTGTGISWIGPTGPTRGKARVYIDGRYTRTVDTYSSRFAPSRVLYSATYATARPRTISIRVEGTKGHPTIAIDAFLVRTGERLVAPTPAPTATPVASTPPTATPGDPPTEPAPTPDLSTTAPVTPVMPTTSRPFPAPVTTRKVSVPSSINPTGSTDVTSALASFINSVPNGSVISFPPDAVYRLTSGIYLRGRNNLVLEGNGATLRMTGGGSSTAHSGFKLDTRNADLAIRDFRVVGSNPNTTTVYNPGAEGAHGILVWDSERIEIDNVDVSHVFGDGMYVGGRNTSPYRPSENIWVHDSSFDYVGRMGFVPNAVRDAVIERNTFNHVGLILLDIEPDHSWEVVDGVHFRDNNIGSYSLSGHQTNWFFAAAAVPGTVSNVYIERNQVSVGASINANNPAGKGGLATRADRASRLRNLVFRDNTTTVPGRPVNGYPGILTFAHIDGLTVTGNVQPVISGTLTSVRDSTGVVVEP